jgi:hypothetical protein
MARGKRYQGNCSCEVADSSEIAKAVDQRHEWRSRGLSDFVLHMKNGLAQISVARSAVLFQEI